MALNEKGVQTSSVQNAGRSLSVCLLCIVHILLSIRGSTVRRPAWGNVCETMALGTSRCLFRQKGPAKSNTWDSFMYLAALCHATCDVHTALGPHLPESGARILSPPM